MAAGSLSLSLLSRGFHSHMHFSVVLAVLITTGTALYQQLEPEDGREGKVFMVRLQNNPCQVGSSNGTCYLKQQCIDHGGEAVGKCQDGLGTCCKFVLGCSNSSNYRTIREKEVVIKDNKECNYEFTKLTDYCQLKIEVTSLYTAPSVNGDCEAGAMTIEGSATVNNFPVCGQVSRPLYASYGQSSRITLSFTRGTEDSSSNYEVKVTHIRCDARDRVPDHCLVEYGGRSGKIESFGYDKGWISGQKYNACVRKSGTTIRWTKCDRSLTHYDTVDPKGPIPSKDFIMSKIWGVYGSFGEYCAEGTSYVSISGNRYCGNHFPNFTTSNDEPFFLAVNMKKDDYAKIPLKLIAVPPHDQAGMCMPSMPFKMSSIIDAMLCAPVMTNAAMDKVLYQCACPKGAQPEPINYDKSIMAFNIGFCLEYTQS